MDGLPVILQAAGRRELPVALITLVGAGGGDLVGEAQVRHVIGLGGEGQGARTALVARAYVCL